MWLSRWTDICIIYNFITLSGIFLALFSNVGKQSKQFGTYRFMKEGIRLQSSPSGGRSEHLFRADAENKMYSSSEVNDGSRTRNPSQQRQTGPPLSSRCCAQTACHSSSRPNRCLFTHAGGLNSHELISDSTGKLLVPP